MKIALGSGTQIPAALGILSHAERSAIPVRGRRAPRENDNGGVAVT
eukprot:CAMPEP_0116969206 /NCGR_PEP_ID=MMETSP0467-20121206/51771_1 /TAXON_ID=283647 /ORGANISM="Mesodinium pulex, Strain SPMC105" /LENGTH=45 /DNA_ID= /DNA_START= /DNA_END= /DNA_ORIENTATION=